MPSADVPLMVPPLMARVPPLLRLRPFVPPVRVTLLKVVAPVLFDTVMASAVGLVIETGPVKDTVAGEFTCAIEMPAPPVCVMLEPEKVMLPAVMAEVPPIATVCAPLVAEMAPLMVIV